MITQKHIKEHFKEQLGEEPCPCCGEQGSYDEVTDQIVCICGCSWTA